ncbi:hypothetical protein BD410DRAFT_813440 [Rickenella mellea]|uniref:Uncharacterized protein n=1 Tax=Rickenella mellea TaxID=50990 RepID=A0A4Y7QEU1_9AGAM|nr:hypothetical protein BD410DRAFT_813440 [Rickenella mellea]
MSDDRIKHTKPISIPATSFHNRPRSASMSSQSDNSPPLQTPVSANTPPKVSTSPTSSPILSYFFAASPTKTTLATPFTRPRTEDDTEHPLAAHARRMSTSWASNNPRFSQTLKANPTAPQPVTEAAQERGAGLLRRLSLSSALARAPPPTPASPAAPPNVLQAPAPQRKGSPPLATSTRKPRRSSTLGVPGGDRPRRAPSPMGERILKGHFDGFH